MIFIFPVLNAYRLVISAFIHITCCLKIYLYTSTMRMGFVFLMRMFQDKCTFNVITINYICDVIADVWALTTRTNFLI